MKNQIHRLALRIKASLLRHQIKHAKKIYALENGVAKDYEQESMKRRKRTGLRDYSGNSLLTTEIDTRMINALDESKRINEYISERQKKLLEIENKLSIR